MKNHNRTHVFIDGMPGTGKTSIREALSRSNPETIALNYFQLQDASLETSLRDVVFDPLQGSTARASTLWMWSECAATEHASRARSGLVLYERSPFTAYTNAAPHLPWETNRRLLEGTLSLLGDWHLLLLTAPDEVVCSRMAGRSDRQGWHPTKEPAEKQRQVADMYGTLPRLFDGRVHLVDAAQPLSNAAAAVRAALQRMDPGNIA